MKKRERGFTLVELLVVIAILGVLSGVAVPRVLVSLQTARNNANAANVTILQSAVERWALDNNPGGTAAGWASLTAAAENGAVRTEPVTAGTHFIFRPALANYISTYPSNPVGTGYQLVFTQVGNVWTATVASY
jgi:prepilin-type N-terminal cleavage/methylation domain-containing protein